LVQAALAAQHFRLGLVEAKELIQSLPQLHLKAVVLVALVRHLPQLVEGQEDLAAAAALGTLVGQVVERLHPDKERMVETPQMAAELEAAAARESSGRTVFTV
jgi:hypothetical protein